MKSIKQAWKILSCLIVFFALVAHAKAQTDNAKVMEEINSANKQFEQVYISSGGAGVATFYAKDAKVLPPNSEMIESNDEIGKFWKGVFDAGVKKFSLTALTVESLGNSAVETGKFVIYDANDKQIDAGKYLVFWKKEKDGWKLFRDIWNTSSPAAKQ
jgi:ketosteroid isomerase-like protein